MQKLTAIVLITLIALHFSFGQNLKGSVITEKFLAPSLQGNPAGENPVRRLTIYLPPGYNHEGLRYPVIYFLHGYGATDSSIMASLTINNLLDTAIAIGHIKPVILVLPDSYTHYHGSFYTNSVLTGNWSDFIEGCSKFYG